ncbi:MAG TPA: response regulator [Anaerolineales bacterium]|nr:response regulator [Anaerolineales bacterium]
MPDKITVLYVEDNRENRLLVRRVLEAEQFTVLEADSAGQALQVLVDHLPDLILMDINLPEIDGYTLTTRLRSDPRLYGVPIIAMTANVMRGDRERTLQAGCDAYIQKPIDVDTLAAQLRRYINEVPYA